jgi:putative ATPase
MDLFRHARQEQAEREAPLAARMRPRTLDEFVGQDHVVGPGRLLRRAIQADQLSSLILCGPPGTGKTTLAMVIANTTRSRFVTLNAVLAGVKDIREVTAAAQEDRDLYSRRTILFIDEVHRWNKAQQDALLPWVENGTIIMIGATTENPWFSVNRALLSRSRVFQLVPLSEDDLRQVAAAALSDAERGYGRLSVDILPEALDHLVDVSNGDARTLLNALELAVTTTAPGPDGRIVIDIAVAEESIQARAVLYDREGDYHFDTISAFIKSVRGSDPDAALYWLAKMIYAGEDPRFILRRLLIQACEDIGLADPYALVVVEAAAAAYDRVGLPEGNFHLAHATLYLATAPKSNSAMAFFDALHMVENEREGEVPRHLKDASRDKEGFGHGAGYQYPHAYSEHWVPQQYLPEALQGSAFYKPGDQGYERRIREQVERRREEQLAAVAELTDTGQDVLTFSPANQAQERWLLRAVGGAGHVMGEVRDRLFAQVDVLRHHTVLDLNAGTGLLTWEALRRVAEGGVWALAREARSAAALREQAAALPDLLRPTILEGDLRSLLALLTTRGEADLRFDLIVGRNGLSDWADKAAAAGLLAGWLRPGGGFSLAETIPALGQRLVDLVDLASLGRDLATRLRQAEEAIYADASDPMVNWDADTLREAFAAAGFLDVRAEVAPFSQDYLVTDAVLDRWFTPAPDGQRPSYIDHLARALSDEDQAAVERAYRAQLRGQTRPWTSAVAFLVGRGPG